MQQAEVRFMPKWTRPIRIPESVPIQHADPRFALAGEKGTWRLPLRLAADIAPGDPLRLHLFGGRNNKGAFKEPQVDRPGEDGCVTLTTEAGVALALRPQGQGGLFVVMPPERGLQAGSVLTATLGDTSGGGGGIEAPRIRQLDKFVFLFRPAGEEDNMLLRVAGQHQIVPAGTKAMLPLAVPNQHQVVAACTVHVLGGKIAHLRAYVPPHTRPGESFDLLVRPEDEFSNLSFETVEDLAVFLGDQALKVKVQQVAESTCVRVRVQVPGEGVHRLRVKDRRTGQEAVTNPTVCAEATPARRLYWGMIHGHTEMSDGTGTLEYYFRQMRDEAMLDFAAPGDHDHVFETSDTMWARTCQAVKRWNESGKFVAILGYEWAKWRKNGDGDRNVYYLEDDRPLYRSDYGHYPTPPDMFRAIQDEEAIVIPHHTGHRGNFCDWRDHDPEHERLVEIFQSRGSYECAEQDGNPVPERFPEGAFADGFVSRALALGWRVGFTAGGDDHTGHAGTDFPIHSGENAYKAGLMAVLACERTREAIWEALWNRRVVATTGPRMLLSYTLAGHPVGSELDVRKQPDLAESRRLHVDFHGTAPVERIDIIRNNDVVYTHSPSRGLDLQLTWEDVTPLSEALLPPAKFCDRPFCFYYVRVVQTDQEVAWASPVWIDGNA